MRIERRSFAAVRATAWWVAGAGWLCAVASALALALLMPLKRVDPFVVRVDNSTGIVDVVPVYAGHATPEEAVTRYFLTHYLTVCERFNFATAESDYEECGAFHSAQRNQAWYALWNATNPASPLNVHKDGSTVRVQVNSVSFFTRSSGLSDLAQVRYLKAARQGAGAEESFTHWVATIQYAYADPAKDPKDAPLESARLQDRRFSLRTRSSGRNNRLRRSCTMSNRTRLRGTTRKYGAAACAICCVLHTVPRRRIGAGEGHRR